MVSTLFTTDRFITQSKSWILLSLETFLTAWVRFWSLRISMSSWYSRWFCLPWTIDVTYGGIGVKSLKTYFVRDIKHLFYIIFCDFNFCGPELTAEYRRNYCVSTDYANIVVRVEDIAENSTFPAWNWHSRCTIFA
jgi:hypothetical protein